MKLKHKFKLIAKIKAKTSKTLVFFYLLQKLIRNDFIFSNAFA